MLIFKFLQKTVFITVFFCALICHTGCKSITDDDIISKATVLSKYVVKFRIKSTCEVNNYYKNAQTIFFPLLMLNPDGSLSDNYMQIPSQNQDYLTFSSNNNINSSIKGIAEKFCERFDFNNDPLLFSLPLDLDESYFIRFYYNVDISPSAYNSVYIKSSIEYVNPKKGLHLPTSNWVGEAHFAFAKDIVKQTYLDIALKKLFKYAFKNVSDSGTFHILDM